MRYVLFRERPTNQISTQMFTKHVDEHGVVVPAAPHELLHSMWKYSDNLAGYEQQDAHEFLMSLLNGIHSHTRVKGISCLRIANVCVSPRTEIAMGQHSTRSPLESTIKARACANV